MSNEKEQKKSVGGIWEKVAKSGKTYMSISLEDKKYVAFRNTFSKHPKAPTWRIYESDSTYTKPVETPAEQLPLDTLDDIPF